MGKVAFLFAGQGAQYPGMGKSLCACSQAAKAVFAVADRVRPGTGEQCFAGTQEALTKTANTQPCVFAVDLAAARALQEAGVRADGAAGFSLGEVAALTFADAFADDAAGFSLVCERGKYMQQANEAHPGKMAAVLKLPAAQVEEICGGFAHVWPVNYNCPGQTVVAGLADEMDAFCAAATAAGARAKLLAVGGGFHSPLMQQASTAFLRLLAGTPMRAPKIAVYANRSAAPYAEPMKDTLAMQIQSPVRWEQSVRRMAADGFDTFVELGPGKTLIGLIKRILPQAALYHVEDKESLEMVAASLAG